MKEINRKLMIVAAMSLALVWSAGVAAHDRWLRPWSVIFWYCAAYSVIVVVLSWCCAKAPRAWIPASILLFLALVLGIPLPSHRHRVYVRNAIPAKIKLRFDADDGSRQKEALVLPNNTWCFTYAFGRRRSGTSISARLLVTDLSNKTTVRRQVELPLTTPTSDIVVSESWWNEAAGGSNPNR